MIKSGHIILILTKNSYRFFSHGFFWEDRQSINGTLKLALVKGNSAGLGAQSLLVHKHSGMALAWHLGNDLVSPWSIPSEKSVFVCLRPWATPESWCYQWSLWETPIFVCPRLCMPKALDHTRGREAE